MSDYDDECIHMNMPALCSICNGREAAERRPIRKAAAPVAKRAASTTKKATSGSPAPVKRMTTRTVSTQSIDTEESVEKYRGKYPGDREATFEAYVEVFFNTEARDFPGGWLAFARCANGEPERKETAPALVARAERLMKDAGYEADTAGAFAGGRRWKLEA